MIQSDLVSRILSQFAAENWQEFPILLGVSGGPDSIAMLRLVHEISKQLNAGCLIVIHANHQLRGTESDGDQAFVQQLCLNLDITFEAFQLPLPARTTDGVESALRDMRYQLFKEAAAKFGARYVLTGHNLNDQTETILFRLLRGTGIAGLAGIPHTRPLVDGVTLIRPLLHIRRAEILEYLRQIGQNYRIDSTNKSLDFTRNKIRNQLLPLIESEFRSDIHNRFESLSMQATEHLELLDHLCQPLLERCCQFTTHGFSLSTGGLEQEPNSVARHLLITAWKRSQFPLRDMTHEKWNLLHDLATPQDSPKQPLTKKHIFPGNVTVVAELGKLSATRNQ